MLRVVKSPYGMTYFKHRSQCVVIHLLLNMCMLLSHLHAFVYRNGLDLHLRLVKTITHFAGHLSSLFNSVTIFFSSLC